jgi:putative peptidoglycan lipid II flippase
VRVHPGDRIDGRYLVYEQTDDNWGVTGWRARDEVLGRDVLLTTFHPEDPRAESLVAAAQAAASVLDAHIARPVGFVVREWTGGQSLSDLLGAGPLPEPMALSIAQDVAEALQSAHDVGQQHLCVDASSVTIDEDGAVRVRGLGTAAVLRGVQPSRQGAARDDARGVGRVLFAALTAKSPVPTPTPLPVVSRTEDSVPAPRQVRAGVSPLLDAITVRALGSGRSHRFAPYATPADVARALSRVQVEPVNRAGPAQMVAAGDPVVPDHLDPLTADPVAGRPALDPAPGTPPPLVPALVEAEHEARPVRHWLRAAVVAVAVMIGVGVFLLGLQLIEANRVPALDPADSPTALQNDTTAATPADDPPVAPTPVVRPVASATDYDPLGNRSENSDRAPLAVDGDPATAWPTQTYFDPLELQKAGVGIVLDLGSPTPVGAVDLTLLGQSSDVEVRVAPEDATELPDTPEGFIQVARTEQAGTGLTLSGKPHTTRWVLVWFTRLPPVANGWRGGVAEAVVRG